MGRHFLLLSSQSWGKMPVPRSFLAKSWHCCPLAHSHPKTTSPPSVSGGSTGKHCLPGTSDIAGLVLLSLYHMCIAFYFLPMGSTSKLPFSEMFVHEGIGKSRLTGMASILNLHLKSHK